MRITLVRLFFLIACVGSVQAAPHSESTSQDKPGWWWYQQTPKPTSPESTEVPAQSRRELPPPPPLSELLQKHPDEIKALLEDYKKEAVWKPTPENVRDYYIIQDAARRKALAFTAVSGMVMLQNPNMNVAAEYPVNPPGISAKARRKYNEIQKYLATKRNEHALIMFTQEHCEYCVEQRASVRYFADKTGWKIKEVDIVKTPAVAARFGIKQTPTIIVIQRNSTRWMPVALGVESGDYIEQNTYRAVKLLRGEITPEQFYTLEFERGGVFDPTAAGEQP